MQPGTTDGGAALGDRIGVLATVVALDEVAPNLVDAATARLDDGVEVSADYPGGALTGWVAVTDDIAVEKSAAPPGTRRAGPAPSELDGISVQYLSGVLDFDDQIEVTGIGPAGFSSGRRQRLPRLPASTPSRPSACCSPAATPAGPTARDSPTATLIGIVLERLGVRLV